MRERGLRTDRAVLAVIDGSKALAKAIREIYGARPDPALPGGSSRISRDACATSTPALRPRSTRVSTRRCTVKRLGLPSKLEGQLSMTNSIVNVMGAVRQLTRRVSGRMILRWTVTAVANAAGRFRRVTGAREGMAALVRALKDHENSATGVAPRKRAA